MISGNMEYITSPIRTISGRVEVVDTSTLAKTGKAVRLEGCKAGEKIYIEAEQAVGLTIAQYGKNLFNYKETTFTNNYIWWKDGTRFGSTAASSGFSCSDYIDIKHLQGQRLFINHTPYGYIDADTSTGNAGAVFYDENKVAIANSGTNGARLTVPTNAHYLRFSVPRAIATAEGADIQIELGDSLTEFEEYKDPVLVTTDNTGSAEVIAYHNNTLIITDFNGYDVELTAFYYIDALADTYTNHDKLKSIQLDRVGENKFFGFGISQKATVVIVDKDCTCGLAKDDRLTITFDDTKISPTLYISDVKRNEVNNELTITAFDSLESAAAHTVAEVNLSTYTIGEFAVACANVIGLSAVLPALDAFSLVYEGGANFDGTETIREAFNAIAEATQTIYYISRYNELVFVQLDKEGAADLVIDKSQYINLENKAQVTLTDICSITELGDNLEAGTGAVGVAQNIYNNPLLELREDLPQVLQNAIAAVGGMSAQQFNCVWRGNYLLEPCDKIALTAKDGTSIYSYLVNDTITYNGGYKQVSKWEFNPQEKGSTTPATLGEAIKQTYAKVDKANKQIDIVVSEVDANKNNLAALQLNTDSISATVTEIAETTKESINAVKDDVNILTNKVNATMTSEQVKIEIETQLAEGVDKVHTTTKGFTFDDAGLSISSSESHIATTITEDGMQIKDSGTEVLTATHEGVKAVDLHATTFLIISNTSRLEDTPSGRTACYWIGG